VPVLPSIHTIRHSSHFSGTALSDTAFYHAKSRTLVVGDLIYNLPNTESMPTYKSSLWKSLSPGGTAHTKIINGAAKDRASVQADAKTVAALDFDRIIPLHGVSSFDQYGLKMHDVDYAGRTLSKRAEWNNGRLRMVPLNCCSWYRRCPIHDIINMYSIDPSFYLHPMLWLTKIAGTSSICLSSYPNEALTH
jgi:hypothetical protein